ncbi:DUF6221 family protein [Streptomyces sp. NPDC057509]|uniref:DUF6221 family protein n=1 Tax=Streptomyces sp. NPDC057509 TaxID=3346152 RepID=UPI00369BFAA5
MDDDDLVQFLRARLAEDEAHALIAAEGRPATQWSLDEWFGREEPHSLIAAGTEKQPVVFGHFTADPLPTSQAIHIARHDPARVLREVEAKRRLLDLHGTSHTVVDGYCVEDGGPCTHRGEAECTLCGETGCTTLRLFALPYADHPDYRESWRP